MSMKNHLTVAAVLVAFTLLALPAYGGVPAVDPGNNTRTYGYVVGPVEDLRPNVDGGFFFVNVPSLGNWVRLDFRFADKSGAHELTVGNWVVIDGYLNSELGCLSGPNTQVRPLIVYRWTTSGWEVYDHDSLTWQAW